MAIMTNRIEKIKITKVIHRSTHIWFVCGAALCFIALRFEQVTMIFET